MKKDVRSMKLTMQLKSRSYDIILKAGCLANLHQFTNVQHRKVFVLTDSGVPAAYAQTVAAQCPDATVYTIPQGEGSKCLKVYGQVLQAMLAFGMDRRDLLVAVGGGVVGDLGGFCAASYMRGIDFVNCPTTVLAQVDSSIGGKTAIDLGETKNIVGAFWQPKVVLVDFDTLKTLPRRQVVNGLAEALKTGLIGDPQLFALFECEHPEENIEQIVYRSLKFKKKIVEQDEREGSVRACLNFGHTIGHGIEAVKGVKGRRTVGLYHGECVALGMLPMIESKALREGASVRSIAVWACPCVPPATRTRSTPRCSTTKRHRAARSPSSRCRVWAAGARRPSRWRVCAPCWAWRTKAMKNTFGSALALTIFGESHGRAIGGVLDGMAAGVPVDEGFIAACMDKRRARGDGLSTPRVEADNVQLLSGVVNGHTTGTAIALMIENQNTRSGDYAKTADLLRPGHADYTAYAKYEGFQDARGGGHFSGRITAASVAAGTICETVLNSLGVKVYTHIAECAGVKDAPLSSAAGLVMPAPQPGHFALLDPAKEEPMQAGHPRGGQRGRQRGRHS